MSIKESALTAIQTIADTDFFRAVTSVGASRKVLASDVGKYVLEDYESELVGSEQSVTDAIDTINDDLNEKNADALDRIKKSLIVDSASGSIASFNDGNDVFPFLSCVVNIEPLQDLHGYDKPWVGGAGKNLMRFRAINTTLRGVTFVSTGEKISIVGTATDNVSPYAGTESTAWETAQFGPYPAGQYTAEVKGFTPSQPTDRIVLSGAYEDGSHIEQFPNGVRISDGAVTFTATAPFKCGLWISITSGSTINLPNVEAILNKGSAIESWTPYENICPITGWTGCEVNVRGKNLLNANLGAGSNNALTYTNTNGTIVVNGTASANTYRTVGKFTPQNGVQYIMTGCPSGGANGKWRMTLGGYGYDYGSGYTFTGDGQEHTISCDVYTGAGLVTDLTFRPMIRLASEADSTYEPYNGQTYSVSWQDEAGTVYGGTVDAVSGVLTTTTICRSGSSFYKTEISTISNNGTNTRFWLYSGSSTLKKHGEMLCNLLPTITTNKVQAWTDYTVGVYDDPSSNQGYPRSIGVCMPTSLVGTTQDSIYNYLQTDALELTYELATPTTYQLDPVQVDCLLGQNNVWADCGDIEEVRFYADPTIYISNLLGTKEDNFTADSAISEGDVFSIGDNMYKATATIAVGETIAVGTNCVQTSITDQINALYALL